MYCFPYAFVSSYKTNKGIILNKPFIIRHFLLDLFEGRKIHQSNSTIVLNEQDKRINTINPPLIEYNGATPLTKNQYIDLCIPADAFDISSNVRRFFKDQDYKDFFARKGKNYSIGSYACESFDKDQLFIIQAFEKKTKDLFENKSFKVNEELLKEYLGALEDEVIPNTHKQKDSVSAMYEDYLENDLSKLLARVLLAVTICTEHKEKKYRAYNPTGDRDYLSDIFVKDVNSSNIKTKDINSKAFYWSIKNKMEKQKYAESFSILQQIAEKIVANSQDYLPKKTVYQCRLHCLYALHLVKGLGCDVDIEKALDFLFFVADDNAFSQFLIYEIYSGKYDVPKDFKTSQEIANTHLKRAVKGAKKQNYFEPLAVMTEKLLAENQNESREISDLLNQSESLTNLTPAQQARLHFNKARYYDLKGIPSKGEYEKAKALGHEEARKIILRLNRKRRKINEYRLTSRNSKSNKICVINATNIKTKSFLQTLPQDYTVWYLGSTQQEIIDNFLYIGDCMDELQKNIFDKGNIKADAKVIFAFLSDDEDKNISFSLKVLDHLYNIAVEKKLFSNLGFVNKFDIILNSDFRQAATFIDASISEMGDETFFKTRICDEALMASRQLLYHYPLFAANDNKQKVNVLVFGDSKFTCTFAKETVAIGYMGEKCPITITLATDDTAPLQTTIFDEMPGLQTPLQSNIPIRFASFDIPFLPLKRTAEQISAEENASFISEQKALGEADYIVIDIGSDMENIDFAIKLRRWYTKNYLSTRKNPFIAVRCSSATNAYWGKRLTLDNTLQGSEWHNSYRLTFFGSEEDLFSYKHIIKNPLDKLAEQIHCSYWHEDSFDALNAFYSFSYNYDSSLATALGLKYRFYIADCYDYQRNQFHTEQYASWLNKNKEIAAICEQGRWNNFCISRGWCNVTPEDLEIYLNYPEINNHKFILAKLHPYIQDWQLLDNKKPIFKTVKMFYARFGKEVLSPQALTYESVDTSVEWIKFIEALSKEQDEISKETIEIEK